MKVFRDGIPLSNPQKELLEPTFTLRRQDETGEKAFSFTEDLIFKGADYDYFYLKLKTDPNALTNKVVLRLEDDCCNPSIVNEFYIDHRSLKWCETFRDCSLTAAAIEKSDAADQLVCLKNTLIWDNYAGFQSKQHPRLSYCNELRPNWLHDVMLILSIATLTSILVIAPAIAGIILAFNTVNIIINAINTLLPSSAQINPITFNGVSQISLNDLQYYYNLLLSFVVGCGRKHPSPLVRDYANNVCGKCGLSFKSDIYNNTGSAYYDTVYMNAPIHKGTLEPDTTTYWIDENKPILSGFKFFNKLKAVTNSEWRIENNSLYFERRDKFIPKTPWLDLTTLPKEKIINICWEHTKKTRYSYASFYYLKDAVNWVGNEAGDRWGDIVEWNPTGSKLQKDEWKPFFEFASCRFRDDGIDRDVLTTYENLPTIGPIIKNYKNSLIMNEHKSYEPILLIWDSGSGVDNAKVKTGYSGTGINPNESYNYPFWVDANHTGNLYDNFHYIDNPNYSGFKGFDFTAEILFDCDLKSKADIDGQIKTIEGLSQKLDMIQLNHATKTMTIKGFV